MYKLTIITTWGQKMVSYFQTLIAAQIHASRFHCVDCYQVASPDGKVIWLVK